MYLIDTPPPTISGSLHLGHILSYSQLATHYRYILRCVDNNIVFPFCYDCNGIPTHQLLKKYNYKYNLIKDFADEYKNTFLKFGIEFSNHSYNTDDELSRQICLLSFEDLKNKGYCYKAIGEYYWSEQLKVSISLSEIVDGKYERTGEVPTIKTGWAWYIKVIEFIPQIKEKINQIKWSNESYKNRLLSWVDSIDRDWCISRERDFGIKIPDEDNFVFDTWFVSSLTPQLAWASHTGVASLQCPIFDIRYQGHDIINTWALYTIIKSLYHNNQIPWKNLVITGHVLDQKGNKFSKSLGNAKRLDDYFDRKNEIAYWSNLATIGQDTRFSEEVLNDGRKLVNKIKNAKRYVVLNSDSNDNPYQRSYEINKIIDYMSKNEMSTAFKSLKQYFWHDFCDKQIEDFKKDKKIDILHNFDDIYEIYKIFGIEIH
jgi:valyl-tRNA synthetase